MGVSAGVASGWLLLAGLAVTSTIGHLRVTQTRVHAESSAAIPFDDVRFV